MRSSAIPPAVQRNPPLVKSRSASETPPGPQVRRVITSCWLRTDHRLLANPGLLPAKLPLSPDYCDSGAVLPSGGGGGGQGEEAPGEGGEAGHQEVPHGQCTVLYLDESGLRAFLNKQTLMQKRGWMDTTSCHRLLPRHRTQTLEILSKREAVDLHHHWGQELPPSTRGKQCA